MEEFEKGGPAVDREKFWQVGDLPGGGDVGRSSRCDVLSPTEEEKDYSSTRRRERTAFNQG